MTGLITAGSAIGTIVLFVVSLYVWLVLVSHGYCLPNLDQETYEITNNNNNTDANSIVNTPTGLDYMSINSFSTLVVGQNGCLLKQDDENLCCPICLDDYSTNDILRILPNCLHRFHSHCIDYWLLRVKATCPICVTSALPIDRSV